MKKSVRVCGAPRLCVGSVEYDSIYRRGIMLLVWNVYSSNNGCGAWISGAVGQGLNG